MTMARRGTIAVPRTCRAIVVAAAALWTASAHSQDAASAECAGLADQAAEIACLRDALDASRKALLEAGARAAAPPAPVERPQAVAGADRPATLGDEQLSRAAAPVPVEQPDPENVSATITASRSDRRGLLVMQLDNGQIWRQSEGTDLPVRIGENERVRVEIARSGFGGYRMSFPDLGRRIAVSRLR
jgi:hypothetical protein